MDVPNVTLTLSMISAAAGIIVSLAFTYIPKLNTWFGAQSEVYKQGFMALAGLIFSFVVFGLGCGKLITLNIPCTTIGATNVLWMWGAWVVGNQSADRASPEPQALKTAKSK